MGIVTQNVFGVVYCIRNTKNGAVYVGMTIQKPKNRWRQHSTALNSNDHHNPHLQHAWNKYGADVFVFEVIQQCSSADELNNAEIGWIEWYRCAGFKLYNQKSGGGFGGSPNKDMRRRLSEAGKGRKVSEETRRRVSEATRGIKKTYTPESYARMVAARTGRPHTEEHRAKISAGGKGRKPTESELAARRARRHSEATRQKMSASQKGRVVSDETRQRMSDAAARRGYQYQVIDPDGNIYITANLSAFCREHNLKRTALHDLARGRYAQHKGWRCSRKEARL